MRWCDDFIKKLWVAWVVFRSSSQKNESMSKSSMLVSIFKCRLWMAWESRLWEDLIYFAAPENSGKTVQGRRLILLPEQPQKMVFVQVLWSSHNICNNLQSSWVLNIKVEESTRSWLFFARTVFFQNWAPRKSHFLHRHTLVQLHTLGSWWFSHINEIERWSVYYGRRCSLKWCLLSRRNCLELLGRPSDKFQLLGMALKYWWQDRSYGNCGVYNCPASTPPNLVNAALSGMTEGTLANSRFSLSGKLSW